MGIMRRDHFTLNCGFRFHVAFALSLPMEVIRNGEVSSLILEHFAGRHACCLLTRQPWQVNPKKVQKRNRARCIFNTLAAGQSIARAGRVLQTVSSQNHLWMAGSLSKSNS